jgi:hypothetical protein
VLRIDARNLPTVKLADSKSIRVGEWVVAIGSPYGFENSVTSGIVSVEARATRRHVDSALRGLLPPWRERTGASARLPVGASARKLYAWSNEVDRGWLSSSDAVANHPEAARTAEERP